MTGADYERKLAEKLEEKGGITLRAAGSGQSTICDLIWIKEGEIYIVESKHTKKETYYTSKDKKQLKELKETAEEEDLIPILAVHRNYKGWELIDLRDGIPKKVSE